MSRVAYVNPVALPLDAAGTHVGTPVVVDGSNHVRLPIDVEDRRPARDEHECSDHETDRQREEQEERREEDVESAQERPGSQRLQSPRAQLERGPPADGEAGDGGIPPGQNVQHGR